MSRGPRAAALAAFALLALAGCDVGYDLVDPEPTQGPTLVVNVAAVFDDSAVYDVRVQTPPGTREGDVLVQGTPARFDLSASGGVASIFTWREARPATDPLRTIVVQSPTGDDARVLTTLTVPVLARSGPADIALAPGADLHLPLTTAPPPGAGVVEVAGGWNLQVMPEPGPADTTRASATPLLIGRGGEPPAEIVVPAALLPGSAGGAMTATLQVQRTLRIGDSSSAPAALVGSRIEWRITRP